MQGELILAEARGDVDFPTGKSGECECMVLFEWSNGWRGDLTKIGLEVRCTDLADAVLEVQGGILCKVASVALANCRLGSA